MYESKAIKFHFEERGQVYRVLITRMNGDTAREAGFSEESYLFSFMSSESDARVSAHSVYAFAKKCRYDISNTFMYEVLKMIESRKIPLSLFDEGQTITADSADVINNE